MASTYRADIARFLYLGIKEVFMKNLQAPRRTYYPQYVSNKTSDKKEEYYDTVGNMKPAQVKAEGAPIQYGKITQGYRVTVTNDTVVNGLQVSYEASKDDLYNVVNTAKTGELVRTMITQKERAVAAIWDGVFTNTGADGVANAASNHPLLNSSSVNDNLASGALTPDNVVAANNKFNHIYNHSGELFDTEGTKLLAHKDKMATVMAILESQLKALELSNTKNTVPALKPVFSKYTNINYWHIIDELLDSVILQEREGMGTDMYYDKKDTKDYFFNVTERYKAGLINPGYGFVSSAG